MKPRASRIYPRELFTHPQGLLATLIGTGLGSGFSPIAPGTAGSVVGLGLLYLTYDWNSAFRWLLIVILSVVGTWAAKEICVASRQNDHQSIVIDEVVGILITGMALGKWGTLRPDFINLGLIFVLFRFFDVLKLPPARQADQWSKTLPANAQWQIGFGVVLDDIAAGLQALLVISIFYSATLFFALH